MSHVLENQGYVRPVEALFIRYDLEFCFILRAERFELRTVVGFYRAAATLSCVRIVWHGVISIAFSPSGR